MMPDKIWKNDVGFLWMLAITLLALISTQLPSGLLIENKFLVRFSFFLFTLIAIRSSALPVVGKVIGYGIASLLLLLAVALIRIDNQGLILVYTICVTCYMVFILALVINQIFASGAITLNKIGGGIAAYILLGHLWATLYFTVYIIQPSSFQHGGESIEASEALRHLSYFSFVTLTTIGYGDILAVGAVARTLVMLEGLIGQLFPAIFIAKLVSLQIEHSRKP